MYRRMLDAEQGSSIIFANDTGRFITAQRAIVLPAKGPCFDNDTIDSLSGASRRLPVPAQKKLLKTGQEKLMAALEQLQIDLGISDQNWNIVNSVGKSALVTLWTNRSNNLVAFIKLFPAKRNGQIPLFWSNTDFLRDTGFGTVDVSKQKFKMKLKPSSLVASAALFTVPKLLEQVAKNLRLRKDLPPEVITRTNSLLKNVASGFTEPVNGAAENMNAYEVDLGEIAQPIALMTGHFVTGAYKTVEDQLLKPLGSSWQQVKRCLFPLEESNSIVDSYLELTPTAKLGISTKNSKGGAEASVFGLHKIVQDHPERFVDMQKKYKYLFNIIAKVGTLSATECPLFFGELYKLISKSERAVIEKALKDPHMKMKDLTKNLQKFLKTAPYKPDVTNPSYTVGRHLLAVLAQEVVDIFNKNGNTVVSFVKEILARSNTIQVKTKMKVSGNNAAFDSFEVIWPPTFTGKVKFDSTKAYAASRGTGGRICFQIK